MMKIPVLSPLMTAVMPERHVSSWDAQSKAMYGDFATICPTNFVPT
jgi:hypothetical protein